MANQTIRIDQLGTAISAVLDGYSKEVKEKADQAGEKAVKKLVKLTKASAPVDTGGFKKNITSTAKKTVTGTTEYHWHVKAPDHRLTHLLVHGHATVDGGRVAGNPFLHQALDEVLPEYLEDIEEALENG
jgi:hypothetical protein